MEQTTSNDYPRLFKLGVYLNAFMLLIVILAFSVYDRGSFLLFDDNGFFFAGYVPTIIYAISVLFGGIGARKKGKFYPRMKLSFLAICAFSMSAYVLNLSMGVFQPFAEWLVPFLIIMHLTLFASAFIEKLPKWLQIILAFLAGISVIISLAQSIHLAELVPISMMVFWFFGISIHTLVPVMIMVVFIFDHQLRMVHSKAMNRAFLTGLIIPVLLISGFIYQWHSSKIIIHEAKASQITSSTNELPTWVLISQNWEDTWLNRRILLGSMVYGSPIGRGFERLGELEEHKRYDPLVSLALMVNGDIAISRDDRIKVFNSRYDGRHDTYRKLWSGKDLEITDVLNEVQVNTQQAHAYIEKTLIIHKPNNRWPRQQEALFTFQLPEGAIATSLSLWVDGVEEKSRLTTKSKADSAYRTIVGRERRDPALLHWQEGNTITVTVFPCTADEDRKVKVGFTIPLDIRNGEFHMENITFKGPPASDAYETTIIRLTDGPTPKLPSRFEAIGANEYRYTGTHNPDWNVIVPSADLTDLSFTFDSLTYRLGATKMELRDKAFEVVYLDVDNGWSTSEIQGCMAMDAYANICVMSNTTVPLEKAKGAIIDFQRKRMFSLFPFQKLDNPRSSMIITNSNVLTPNISDLKASAFGRNLQSFMTEGAQPPLVMDLSEHHSPYLQTLAQFGLIDLRHESLSKISEMLKSGKVPFPQIPSNSVAVGTSGYHITESPADPSDQAGANDQLMRLHHYNKIMADIGPAYFTADNYIEGHLIDMANSAFVVSPISSLIVLETQKDYERFDIEKNKNSLNNASVGSSGSVPEPHEWALIILALCIPLYHFLFKRA